MSLQRGAAGLAAVALIFSLAAGACNQGGGSSTIQVDDAWARSSPQMAMAGAVYLTIANTGSADDALVAASVPSSVAATAEIHETVEGESDGMMAMRPVERMVVPANGSVALEPGGYHVMLLDLAAPLEAGTTIEVTLSFEGAGEMVITAEVREAGM
jgi:periplasmic copper chaperone A